MNIHWTYRPSRRESLDALIANRPKLVAFTTSALIAGIGASAIEFLLKAYSQQKRAIPFSITVGARAGWALTVLAGTALAYKLCRDRSSSYYSDFQAWGKKVGSSVQYVYQGENIPTQGPNGNRTDSDIEGFKNRMNSCRDAINGIRKPTHGSRMMIEAILLRICDAKRLKDANRKEFIQGFEDAVQPRTEVFLQLYSVKNKSCPPTD